MFNLQSALLLFASLAPVLATVPVIQRDVCIIGGGSSGTHAAIQLQQAGKAVALIEKQARLGGHVNTYVQPGTGRTHDYGVVVFNNISAVRSYFQHWDIPLAPLAASSGVSRSVNFNTGQEVTNPLPLGGPEVDAALKLYLQQILKYPGIKQEWNLPYPVPDDLLMNFGDFLEKYKLQAIAPLAYNYNQGAGNVLAQPTLFMLKYFERQQVHSILDDFVVNKLDDNQLIYNKAKAELGQNAFLSSFPTRISRSANGVDVLINTPRGSKLIRAKKLLISIEPLLNSLNFLDLDQNEKSIFRQFNNSYYYDAIVENTGIPDNTSLGNADPAAPHQIPPMPGVYGLTATPFSNTHAAYYGASHAMSDDDVKADILASIAKARAGLGYPAPSAKPKIAQFNAHNPFELTVSAEAVKNGFYKRLQALQGEKNTFYTGAAWNLQASSNLWQFNNQIILPKIMKALKTS